MVVCLFACFLWVRFVFDPASFAAASDDYSNYWREGATWRDLLRDVVFMRSYLNPVTWTLAVEMIAAVLFVPLWWINRRSRPVMLVLTAAWGAWFLSTPHPSFTAFVFMMLLGVHIEPAARLATRHLGARATVMALALSFLGTGPRDAVPARNLGRDMVRARAVRVRHRRAAGLERGPHVAAVARSPRGAFHGPDLVQLLPLELPHPLRAHDVRLRDDRGRPLAASTERAGRRAVHRLDPRHDSHRVAQLPRD